MDKRIGMGAIHTAPSLTSQGCIKGHKNSSYPDIFLGGGGGGGGGVP